MDDTQPEPISSLFHHWEAHTLLPATTNNTSRNTTRRRPIPTSKHPRLLDYPGALNLDGVLLDLWPSLSAQYSSDYHPFSDSLEHLQFPHHLDPSLTFSARKLPPPVPNSAFQEVPFDDYFSQHIVHPSFPSPLTSPPPSSDIEATSTSCRQHRHCDTSQHPPFAESDLEQRAPYNMVKNRRSLQSILIPPFLQSHSPNDASSPTSPTQSSTRTRSHSAAASVSSLALPPAIPIDIPPSPVVATPVSPDGCPPSDLLDDDPFADLSAGPSVLRAPPSRSRSGSLLRVVTELDGESDSPAPSCSPPCSPLSHQSFMDFHDTSFSQTDAYPPPRSTESTPVSPTLPPTPLTSPIQTRAPRRPWSSGHGQARSAYTRPAFKPRPSLPSLHALAQAQVLVPKVRRGRVGAQLPLEPWQSQPLEDEVSQDVEAADNVDSVPPVPSPTSPVSVSPPDPNRTLRRNPGILRPSALTTIRDSKVLPEPEPPSGFATHTSLDGLPEPVGHNDAEPSLLLNTSVSELPFSEVEAPSPTWTTAPGLARAHSEPSSSLRPLATLPRDLHTRNRSSFPPESEANQFIPTSPTTQEVKREPSWEKYSNAFLTNMRYTDLPSPLVDSIEDVLSNLNPPSPQEALEAIGYTVTGHTPLGKSSHSESTYGFEPGSSAETIRTLNASHRRTPPDLDHQGDDHIQGLDWRLGAELLGGMSTSPQSPSFDHFEGSSGGGELDHSSQLAYDLEGDHQDHDHHDHHHHHHLRTEDLLSFHSDSSGEHPTPTLTNSTLSISDSLLSTPAVATPPSFGPTPYNSYYEDQDAPFELDEDIVRHMPRSSNMLSRESSYGSSDPGESKYATAAEELADMEDSMGSGGAGGRRSDYQGSFGGSSQDRWNGVSGGRGSNGNGAYSNGGTGGHGRDDDERWNRRPPMRPALPVQNDSETSDEEEEEEKDDSGYDDDTRTGMSPKSPVNTRTVSRPPIARNQSETDDDVPLAQQLPTALTAQKTIRRQVKDEIDLRRRESRRKVESKPQSPVSQSPPANAVPRTRGSFKHDHATLENTREALLAAAPPMPTGHPGTRPRTKTLPSNPFSPNDLKARLLGIQTSSGQFGRRTSEESGAGSPKLHHAPQQLPQRFPSLAAESSTIDPRHLRAQRSFHRPRPAEAERPPIPSPSFPQDFSRHGRTTSTSKRPSYLDASSPPREDPRFSLERTRSRSTTSRRPSIDNSCEAEPFTQSRRPPMPPLPSAEVVNTFSHPASPPLSSFPYPPTLHAHSHSHGHGHVQTPAPPPAPVQKQVWQQRVFIASLQRYCQVEVDTSTTAGDVLRILDSQGMLPGSSSSGSGAGVGASAGGWMMWEICNDFGMERPIRSYELLTSVSSSWVPDKSTNVFMAKKTLLSPILSRTAIPSSSPTCSGYVQHEYKRGKWQKRWMELKEHGLWLSKKDTGKDQVCLCSLSNFDAYVITRVTKAPKGYVFAIKSTDSLSFFEDTSDYLHLISCGEKEGANWLQKILLARSYILHQEGNVLTNTSVPNNNTSNGTSGPSASLSRSGTRKRPAQPLVNIGHISTPEVPNAPIVFEAGSLMAKRF